MIPHKTATNRPFQANGPVNWITRAAPERVANNSQALVSSGDFSGKKAKIASHGCHLRARIARRARSSCRPTTGEIEIDRPTLSRVSLGKRILSNLADGRGQKGANLNFFGKNGRFCGI
jgi:hypothetical protein